MKKILVEYFSCQNLGDDLFIKELAERFPQYSISLLGNPLYYTKEFGPNVRFHKFSYVSLLISKICALLQYKGHICASLENFNKKILEYLKNKAEASVYIGGSLFVSQKKSETEKEIEFLTNEKPKYDICSTLNSGTPEFLIGTNLGPCYSEQYWKNISDTFEKYMHVTLRDYSSYCKVKHLLNVQYAPDVLFNVKKPLVSSKKSLVMSLVLAEICVQDKAMADAYYQQMARIADYYIEQGFDVTAVAFCEKLGDVKAIERMVSYLKNPSCLKRMIYKGNIQECIELFASAKFVLGTRFHSVILSLNFEKPVLPIVYNCKTTNYLYDVGFEGKIFNLNNINQASIQDLLSNFSSDYTAECSNHRKYAENQFWGLEEYLKK